MLPRAVIFFFLICALSPSVAFELDEKELLGESDKISDAGNYYQYAKFRLLDKVSDKSFNGKFRVDNTKNYFEKLQIKVKKCWGAAAYAEKESAAYIEVFERLGAANNKLIFAGWVFENNSFLTNIEHRQYDLRLLGCFN